MALSGKGTPLSLRVFPASVTRLGRSCPVPQEDRVFADFDVDAGRRVCLRGISFNGDGCWEGGLEKMSSGDSGLVMELVGISAARFAALAARAGGTSGLPDPSEARHPGVEAGHGEETSRQAGGEVHLDRGVGSTVG
jgi:hypothetical protein